MTPDRNDQQPEENTEHGVLDDSGNVHTSRLDILGGPATEQISVIVPAAADDDLLDDDVVDDELDPARIDAELESAELPRAGAVASDTGEVVIVDYDDDDDHDDEDDAAGTEDDATDAPAAAGHAADAPAETAAQDDVVEAEVIEAAEDDRAEAALPASDPSPSDAEDEARRAAVAAAAQSAAFDALVREEMDAAAAAAKAAADAKAAPGVAISPVRRSEPGVVPTTTAGNPLMSSRRAVRTGAVALPPRAEQPEPPASAEPAAAPAPAEQTPAASASAAPAEPAAAEPEPVGPAPVPAAQSSAASPAAQDAAPEADVPEDAHPETGSSQAAEAARPESGSSAAPAETEAATAAEPVDAASVPRPAPARASRRAVTPSEPADRTQALERVNTRAEVPLTSKRLGEFEPGRESSDLLTADRLLDKNLIVRPEPEGAWRHFIYSITGKRINLGDGRRARRRKELDRRIAVPLNGNARFVPVLSRKGGVGKTTITTLLGMALADARDDRIIAIDANPDRGTLAERIARASGKTIRDLVRVRSTVRGYNDISGVVSRDETRLDVLASDTDPRVSEALSDTDYQDVASLAAHYYSIVLTDTGTGIVHSVMGATLDLADQLIVVSGLSVDEARLASETLTWLETNGYAEQVRGAIVVLNSGRPGPPLVKPAELEKHFGTRVRAVVRMPYDPLIAAGSAITFRDLQPETRLAARELAATVVEGLRALSAVS